MEKETFISNNENQTVELGNSFAKKLKPGDTVAFFGALGTGKTQFIKGICDFFKVEEIVVSPTFNIMNQYKGQIDDDEVIIYHIDLYRIKKLPELDEIGFKECVYSNNSIKLIEWAEKANGDLPAESFIVQIDFNPKDENERLISISRL